MQLIVKQISRKHSNSRLGIPFDLLTLSQQALLSTTNMEEEFSLYAMNLTFVSSNREISGGTVDLVNAILLAPSFLCV